VDDERVGHGLCLLGERFGSGDGEREAPMTRQMPYEPLPASVLFGFFLVVAHASVFRGLEYWSLSLIKMEDH
jgi:hypothetical protein